MPFDPEKLESEPSVSAEEGIEPSAESELSESPENVDFGVAAQGHTVKVGSVG